MRIFQCRRCFQPVFFENTTCEKCGASLGFLSSRQVLSTLADEGEHWTALADSGTPMRYCRNHEHGVCNWLIPVTGKLDYCTACELNRTVPNLETRQHLRPWKKLEWAKHRLIYSILRFGLPLESKTASPQTGICFDFLSDDPNDQGAASVVTGHSDGVITINLAEADSVRRERIREEMAEPYRTVIGHFRHEIGHYYWERLVGSDPDALSEFRVHFGDERADYAEAIRGYHVTGPVVDWRDHYISAYSSAHPWEAWAETWAHYFHLVDTLETAWSFRLQTRPDLERLDDLNMQADFDPYGQSDIEAILAACIPLFFAINSLNRSMGQPDLYPFVIPPPVAGQLRMIHQLIRRHRVIQHPTGT